MISHKPLSVLIFSIAIAATAATLCGILSSEGPGPYKYLSVRGEEVLIYGKGIYKHMSAEVAPQGIAQDFVTLFLGVPLVIFAYVQFLKKKKGAPLLLAGVLGYFLVTYLFYLVMAMYNVLFLLYVFLAGASFFSFITILSLPETKQYAGQFSKPANPKFAGTFLVVNAVLIGLLWLSIVLPPLFNGSIIPKETEHYTTLIVQGLDLAILLPAALVIGLWLRRQNKKAVFLGPIYLIFLSLLMTALTAKIIAMGTLGYNIIPVVFIIPVINVLSAWCAISLLKGLQPDKRKLPAKMTGVY